MRENLRHCIKLCEDKRQSFLRVILLFSLPHQDIDEDREVSKQLIMLHYVKTSRVQFPTFAILKTTPVFSTKEELNWYVETLNSLKSFYRISLSYFIFYILYLYLFASGDVEEKALWS